MRTLVYMRFYVLTHLGRHNRLKVDQEAVQLARSVRGVLPGGRWVNSNVNDFLRCDSPTPETAPLLEIPLFPRNKCVGDESPLPAQRESRAPGISTLKDLPSVLAQVLLSDDLENELYKEHMKVINGWSTHYTPPRECG